MKCSARHAARDAAAPASALNPGALSDRFGDSLRGTRDSSDGARTPHRTDIPSPKSAGRPARPAWSSRRSSSQHGLLVCILNAFAMAAVQGKLYAAGGVSNESILATAEVFDPQQNRWEAVANMARGSYHCAACAI